MGQDVSYHMRSSMCHGETNKKNNYILFVGLTSIFTPKNLEYWVLSVAQTKRTLLGARAGSEM